MLWTSLIAAEEQFGSAVGAGVAGGAGDARDEAFFSGAFVGGADDLELFFGAIGPGTCGLGFTHSL
jgi:hypothetical protein